MKLIFMQIYPDPTIGPVIPTYTIGPVIPVFPSIKPTIGPFDHSDHSENSDNEPYLQGNF